MTEELKTLKELIYNTDVGNAIEPNELKQEAIKWIKAMQERTIKDIISNTGKIHHCDYIKDFCLTCREQFEFDDLHKHNEHIIENEYEDGRGTTDMIMFIKVFFGIADEDLK